MRKLLLVAACALALGGCSANFTEKLAAASNNFRQNVAQVNANIAAVAPLVAESCDDLQYWTALLAEIAPSKGKARQYFGAANGALSGYCTDVPTDIKGTVAAVKKAVGEARRGYDQVK